MSLLRSSSVRWAVEPLDRRIHSQENDPDPALSLFCPKPQEIARAGVATTDRQTGGPPTSIQTNTDRGM